MMHLVFTLGTWALVGTFLASFIFVVVYWIIAPWWRSEVGRHLMSFEASMALITAYLVAVNFGWLDPRTGQYYVRLVIYGVLFLLVLWRISILIRAQRRNRIHESVLEPSELSK